MTNNGNLGKLVRLGIVREKRALAKLAQARARKRDCEAQLNVAHSDHADLVEEVQLRNRGIIQELRQESDPTTFLMRIVCGRARGKAELDRSNTRVEHRRLSVVRATEMIVSSRVAYAASLRELKRLKALQAVSLKDWETAQEQHEEEDVADIFAAKTRERN